MKRDGARVPAATPQQGALAHHVSRISYAIFRRGSTTRRTTWAFCMI